MAIGRLSVRVASVFHGLNGLKIAIESNGSQQNRQAIYQLFYNNSLVNEIQNGNSAIQILVELFYLNSTHGSKTEIIVYDL